MMKKIVLIISVTMPLFSSNEIRKNDSCDIINNNTFISVKKKSDSNAYWIKKTQKDSQFVMSSNLKTNAQSFIPSNRVVRLRLCTQDLTKIFNAFASSSVKRFDPEFKIIELLGHSEENILLKCYYNITINDFNQDIEKLSKAKHVYFIGEMGENNERELSLIQFDALTNAWQSSILFQLIRLQNSPETKCNSNQELSTEHSEIMPINKTIMIVDDFEYPEKLKKLTGVPYQCTQNHRKNNRELFKKLQQLFRF